MTPKDSALAEKHRLLFEAWASEKGFELSCQFFDEGNNYEDANTKLAFEIWTEASIALHKEHKQALENADAFITELREELESVKADSLSREAVKSKLDEIEKQFLSTRPHRTDGELSVGSTILLKIHEAINSGELSGDGGTE